MKLKWKKQPKKKQKQRENEMGKSKENKAAEKLRMCVNWVKNLSLKSEKK